jgi:hypothetical protein
MVFWFAVLTAILIVLGFFAIIVLTAFIYGAPGGTMKQTTTPLLLTFHAILYTAGTLSVQIKPRSLKI